MTNTAKNLKQITSELSGAARRALTNTAGRQGAVPPSRTPWGVSEELYGHGLTGPEGGLTSRGVTVRERVMSEDLDRAFGSE